MAAVPLAAFAASVPATAYASPIDDVIGVLRSSPKVSFLAGCAAGALVAGLGGALIAHSSRMRFEERLREELLSEFLVESTAESPTTIASKELESTHGDEATAEAAPTLAVESTLATPPVEATAIEDTESSAAKTQAELASDSREPVAVQPQAQEVAEAEPAAESDVRDAAGAAKAAYVPRHAAPARAASPAKSPTAPKKVEAPARVTASAAASGSAKAAVPSEPPKAVAVTTPAAQGSALRQGLSVRAVLASRLSSQLFDDEPFGAQARRAMPSPLEASHTSAVMRRLDGRTRVALIDRRVPRFDDALYPSTGTPDQGEDSFLSALAAMEASMPLPRTMPQGEAASDSHVDQLVQEEIERNRKASGKRFSRSKLKVFEGTGDLSAARRASQASGKPKARHLAAVPKDA